MGYETYMQYVWACKTPLLLGATLLALGLTFEYTGNESLAPFMYVPGGLVVATVLALPLLLRDHLEK